MQVPPRRRPPDAPCELPDQERAFAAVFDDFDPDCPSPAAVAVDACLDPDLDWATWNHHQDHQDTVGPPDPWARLATARRTLLDLTVLGLTAGRRVPRVCRYALAHGTHRPTHSLYAASQAAARRGWQVGGEEQVFTDPYGSPAPQDRTGWCRVRRHIKAGYADGVVVVTTDVITTDLTEFEKELAWLEAHNAFLAVVVPLTDTPQSEPSEPCIFSPQHQEPRR
jgi:hypothetical protein